MNRRATITACLGKPYRAGAVGPDAFDCFGLVTHLAGALHGITVPRDGAGILRARRIFASIAMPIDGAIVIMGASERHVGLWLAPESVVIHAIERRGVVIDDLQTLLFSGFGRPRFFARRSCIQR
ncbi:NlpC/P60 family protein [Lichenihabitans psoromatis]|uniref:NlpC/P60 family protein n=1 Tax=Lichenihabitans psoromatis TaxID=2528642 RepID=UPI0010382EB9|nr:NlpC/P60 family protein [Lichenihabitans psoromatis]